MLALLKTLRRKCSPEQYRQMLDDAEYLESEVSNLEILFAHEINDPNVKTRMIAILKVCREKVRAHKKLDEARRTETLREDLEDRLEMLFKAGPGGMAMRMATA